MLFYSFFKSLVGKDVVVELKNDLAIAGTLHSVDQVIKFNQVLEQAAFSLEKYYRCVNVKKS